VIPWHVISCSGVVIGLQTALFALVYFTSSFLLQNDKCCLININELLLMFAKLFQDINGEPAMLYTGSCEVQPTDNTG